MSTLSIQELRDKLNNVTTLNPVSLYAMQAAIDALEQGDCDKVLILIEWAIKLDKKLEDL